LGGLTGAYFFLGKTESSEAEATEAPSKSVTLLKKDAWEVESVTFDMGEEKLTLLPVVLPTHTPVPTAAPDPEATAAPTPAQDNSPTPKPTPTPEIEWRIENHETAPINTTTVNDMARLGFSLTAAEKIADSGDVKEFGLDQPRGRITALYTDGSSEIINVGVQTPAKDYYYAMREGDPAIYMIYTTTGERIFKNLGDLLDTTIPALTADTLEYVLIKQKGKDPIEFDYLGTEEEKTADIEQFGAFVINMVQPFKGWELYATNFQTNVIDKLTGMTIDNLEDANPTDYARYGLDDPELEFWIKDSAGEIHLLVGSEKESGVVYVKYPDYPYVFSMKKSGLAALYDVNIFGFTQRFIALQNIDNIESGTVKSVAANYEFEINHKLVPVTATPTPTPDPAVTPTPAAENPEPLPTPAPKKEIHPTFNGQSVQDEAFRNFYQILIGLSYDSAISDFTKSGDPVVTINYVLNTGDPDVTVKFHEYNNDFYAVEKDEEPIRFVIGKQYVNNMFQSAIDLLAGKLDE
jgi:hypothetical protein